MAQRSTPGVHPSFLDLFCCALGAAILLVVMFATRLQSGQAVEDGTFVVIAYKLDEEAETLSTLMGASRKERGKLSATVGDNTLSQTLDFEPNSTPNDGPGYNYRWLIVRPGGLPSNPDNTEQPLDTVYLVITNIETPLTLDLSPCGDRPGLTATLYISGDTRTIENVPNADPIEIELAG